jgi:hypothetical protein
MEGWRPVNLLDGAALANGVLKIALHTQEKISELGL